MRNLFKSITRQQIDVGVYALAIIVVAFGACMVLWYSAPMWREVWQLICAVCRPILYGVMLAFIFNPLVTYISGLLARNKNLADNASRRRTIATAISAIGVVLVLLGIIVALAVMLSDGISSLNVDAIGGMIEEASNDITGFIKMVQERLTSWGLLSEDGGGSLVTAFSNVSDAATTALFSIIFAIYFLLDGQRLYAYAKRIIRNLLGDRSSFGERLFDDADDVFSRYFRGQAIDASIVGVLTAVTLTIAGIPYAPIIGLITGLANLIPYLGGIVGFGSIALVCVPEGLWMKLVLGIAIMAVVMFVDGNIINPKLLSDSIEVHPMLVVAALIAGSAVGGALGMLVAVPVAALLKLQLDRWMEKNEATEESVMDRVTARIEGRQ